MWPWKTGVAMMVDFAGPEKGTIQHSEDGFNFEVCAAVEDIPPASGAYIPDKFADSGDGQGFTWGLCYCKADWDFLVRFECDLSRGEPKTFEQRWKHYGTLRDVMRNPSWFGLPPQESTGSY